MNLKGVIVEFWGNNHSYIRLDNCKDPIAATATKLQLKTGFDEGYSYRKGDSVLKTTGSNLITYKRGNSIAVYLLDCSEK